MFTVSEGSTPQYVYGVVAAVGVFMIVILGLLAVGGFICYHYMFQRRKWVLEPEVYIYHNIRTVISAFM